MIYDGADQSVKVPRVRQVREHSCTRQREVNIHLTFKSIDPLWMAISSLPCLWHSCLSRGIYPSTFHWSFPTFATPSAPWRTQRGDFAVPVPPLLERCLHPRRAAKAVCSVDFPLSWALHHVEFNWIRDSIHFPLDPAHWLQNGIWNSLLKPTSIMSRAADWGWREESGGACNEHFSFSKLKPSSVYPALACRCIDVLDSSVMFWDVEEAW